MTAGLPSGRKNTQKIMGLEGRARVQGAESTVHRLRAAPVLALILLGLILSWSGTAAAAGSVRIAILPIVVHSTDEHEYLQQGMAEMLTSRMRLLPQVSVVRVEDTATATTDATEARESARAVNADYVLFGSFTRFGEGASLDVECARVDGGGDVRRVFVQSGTLGEIIPKLDGLAQKIARFAQSDGADLPAVGSGPGGPDAPAGDGVDAGRVDALERRLEALERVVLPAGAEGSTPVEDVRRDDLADSDGDPVR